MNQSAVGAASIHLLGVYWPSVDVLRCRDKVGGGGGGRGERKRERERERERGGDREWREGKDGDEGVSKAVLPLSY